MPTLDYYGFEHEDAITGFVAEYEAQVFNRCVFGRWQGLLARAHALSQCTLGRGCNNFHSAMSSTFRCTAKPLLLLLAFHDSTGTQERGVSFIRVPATLICLRRPCPLIIALPPHLLPQGRLGRLPPGHPAGGGEGQGQHLHPGGGAPVGRALRAALRQAPHHAGATTAHPLAAWARLDVELVQAVLHAVLAGQPCGSSPPVAACWRCSWCWCRCWCSFSEGC